MIPLEERKPILYITGTNTHVGKTFLAAALLRRASQRGIQMAAFKPFCSGGRDDAAQLHALQTAGLTLDQVNPFYFEEPVTPLVAARNSGRSITFRDFTKAHNTVRARGLPMLVEGAGGLLSPLSKSINLRKIISIFPGPVCVVAPNALGTINSVLLTLRALPKASSASVVLMEAAERDSSAATNAAVIQEIARVAVYDFPRLRNGEIEAVTGILDALLDPLCA